ncbi:IclR family transcriptional regulator [Mycobacterium simiae]|uniref:IclR family transcriptional regulator n=1 Tax=Mycobacterium simiae TaxID=1784 RepID=UPI0003FCFA95|nr:IclR family transcriptional regulator [Mycobacterium simiae]PLV49926.1 IclR family transcriptional regulator [Mycobacterium tuberculosis variant microti OV254]BBX39459.1 IclR family transcriptional regulator [Mycobacterium simiae]
MGEIHSIDEAAALAETALTGDTPTLRLFSLLELIATKNQLFTLQGLVELTGTPKPTLHRMLQQLEGAGLLIRENNGRHYVVGARLRRMAESLLLNDTHHGARHSVLRSLVEELGESCNLTALSGDEILYVDRVETLEPLRFTLQPGSRVPVHCSASGKMILSQLAPVQRRRLLEAAPLKQYTPNTITDVDQIEEQLKQVRRDGYAIDDQEFLPGLVCAAVLVPSPSGISNLGIAVQAPVMRLTPDKALRVLPALRRAADAIGQIEAETAGESSRASS